MALHGKGFRRRMLWAAALGFAGYKLLQRLTEADLRGQVVLITGGSRGLGFLLAREFGRQGCRVAICARYQRELDSARDDPRQQGIDVLAVPCDVTDRLQVDRMVQNVTKHFGRIDILVNNAGIIQVGPVVNLTEKDFENALAVMFWGVLHPTLAVIPQMRDRHSGRIVNITSIGGMVSVPHLLPYNSAKFAAVGLSEGLRAELAREGITVTTIAPGTMRTGSHLNALFRGRQQGEFTWFALGASLPFLSMDAERAARQIVRATKRGEAVRILGLPAKFLERFHGLFPGTTDNLMAIVNRFLLPSAETDSLRPLTRGLQIQQQMQSRLFEALTVLSRSAAHRFQKNDAANA